MSTNGVCVSFQNVVSRLHSTARPLEANIRLNKHPVELLLECIQMMGMELVLLLFCNGLATMFERKPYWIFLSLVPWKNFA